MKPTFVLAIADNHLMDNLNHIARQMDVFVEGVGDVRIITHTSPEWSHGKTGLVTNFDMLITNGTARTQADALWQDILPEHRVHVSKRPTKLEMGINLDRWAREMKLKHFLAIPTHVSSYGALRQSDFGHDLTGKVVIKPNHGARGIGHFVIDADRVSLETFLHDLNTVMSQPEQERFTRLKEMVATYEPHVVIGGGAENFDGEGMKMISEQGLVVQQLVDEVMEEYRVLLDVNSMPSLILRRNRLDKTVGRKDGNVYLQATGVLNKLTEFTEVRWDDVIDAGDFVDAQKAEVIYEMEKMFKKLPGMSSVDLFLKAGVVGSTDPDLEPKFGFFEYCNQFGTAGIPMARSRIVHAQYASQLLERYLKAEGKLLP